MKKTIALSLILLLIVTAFLGCQPEKKRNKSSSDVKIVVDFEDVDNRTPIIRTYTNEEFKDFGKKKLMILKTQ